MAKIKKEDELDGLEYRLPEYLRETDNPSRLPVSDIILMALMSLALGCGGFLLGFYAHAQIMQP